MRRSGVVTAVCWPRDGSLVRRRQCGAAVRRLRKGERPIGGAEAADDGRNLGRSRFFRPASGAVLDGVGSDIEGGGSGLGAGTTSLRDGVGNHDVEPVSGAGYLLGTLLLWRAEAKRLEVGDEAANGRVSNPRAGPRWRRRSKFGPKFVFSAHWWVVVR